LRSIPHDFPKWGIVRYYYDVWTKKNENGESVLDSKTIQNANTAEEKGYDGGKKIGCEGTYSHRCSLSSLQTVLCDGGYTGDDFANKIYELTGAKVQVAKRSELHTFTVIPKRWIIERSFGWPDKLRNISRGLFCAEKSPLHK